MPASSNIFSSWWWVMTNGDQKMRDSEGVLFLVWFQIHYQLKEQQWMNFERDSYWGIVEGLILRFKTFVFFFKCLKRHMNIEHQWKEEASWQRYINHLIVGNHSNILPKPNSSRVPNKRAWGKMRGKYKIVGGPNNRAIGKILYWYNLLILYMFRINMFTP